jgi:ATP-dependent DNA ligase
MTERGGSIGWFTPAPMTAYAKPKELAIDDYKNAGGWVAEPKIDGHRITVRVRDGEAMAWTRPGPGRPYGLQRDLGEYPGLLPAVCALPNGVYDGELAELKNVLPWKSLPEGWEQKAFFAFDLLETLETPVMEMRYTERRAMLEVACGADTGPLVQFVPTIEASDEQYEKILELGGEGVMLKTERSIYRPGARTREWLKVKDTQFAKTKIVGFKAAIRGPYATLKLRDVDGVELTVSTPNNVIRMAERDADALLGETVIIKYQMRTGTANNSYRHPRFDTAQTFALWTRRGMKVLP